MRKEKSEGLTMPTIHIVEDPALKREVEEGSVDARSRRTVSLEEARAFWKSRACRDASIASRVFAAAGSIIGGLASVVGYHKQSRQDEKLLEHDEPCSQRVDRH